MRVVRLSLSRGAPKVTAQTSGSQVRGRMSISKNAVMYRSMTDLRTPRRSPGSAERAPVVLSGAALTLMIHLLLISPLLLGTGHHMHAPPSQEGGETSGVPAITLISLQDDLEDSLDTDRASVERLLLAEPKLLPMGDMNLASTTMPAVPSRFEDADVTHSPQESPSDSTDERALMFGRYLGQVTARIERAWLRPRSPIGATTFTCLVQVEQNSDRNVKEVMLRQCNGTVAWQLSLVRAIESASPFPAPPDRSVFSPTLTFQMTADAFVQGGPTDGYEPAPRELSAARPWAGRRQPTFADSPPN